MNLTSWLVIVGILLAVQAQINRRQIMAGMDEALAAVDAARVELADSKSEILAELARLGLPDADLQPLIDKVKGLGSSFDDVPGVTPGLPPVEPPPVEPPVS